MDVQSKPYFFMAKNITDPSVTQETWRNTMDRHQFDVYMRIAEALTVELTNTPYMDIHEIVDEQLDNLGLAAQMQEDANKPIFHYLHSQMGFYIRNVRSVLALKAMREFPVHIYGRGWDRVAQHSPAHHVFHAARSMSESQRLFYESLWGLVDISPSKALHDRTLRAMANNCPFISSANIEEKITDPSLHASLFFTFEPDNLAEKCHSIVSDPEAHARAARRFAATYYDRFHFRGFVQTLDCMAKSVTQW